MACTVVMDLKPNVTKFTLSKTQKSATISCSFIGRYAPSKKAKEAVAEIELMVASRSGNKALSTQVSELEALIADGGLLRVTGSMRRFLYQDRNSGAEVELEADKAITITASDNLIFISCRFS